MKVADTAPSWRRFVPPVIAFALILLPDLGNLCADHADAWRMWLALQQASLAAMAVLVAVAPRSNAWNASFLASGLWYAVQSVDELVAGNFFGDGVAEYPMMGMMFVALCLYIHRHATD